MTHRSDPVERRTRIDRAARFVPLLLALTLAWPARGHAQTQLSREQMQALERAQAQLTQYLRCEQDTVNSFGESNPPEATFEVLEYLGKLQGKKNDANPNPESGVHPVSLPIWDGIAATVVVAAGYGFFAIQQVYPLSSHDALLKAWAKRGWELKPVPSDNTFPHRAGSIVNAMISAHKAVRPLAGQVGRNTARTVELHVVEATAALMEENQIAFNGLTVTCRYSTPTTDGKKP